MVILINVILAQFSSAMIHKPGKMTGNQIPKSKWGLVANLRRRLDPDLISRQLWR